MCHDIRDRAYAHSLHAGDLMPSSGPLSDSKSETKSGYGKDIYQRPGKPIRRVVVTGIGVISPLGLNLEETWKNAVAGVSGIDRITQFDTAGYDTTIAGEIKSFDPNPYVEKKEQKKMDRFIQLSMAAAEMAMKDSGVVIDERLSPRAGALVGVGMGGLISIEAQHSILKDRGPSRLSPFFIPMVITNMASGNISIKYKLRGPNFSVTSACATGANSIGEAANYIRRGLCDVMLAGGSEATVLPNGHRRLLRDARTLDAQRAAAHGVSAL